jgi:hypothetical protein
MKRFLIFLAIAAPIALASPYFWSLVRMAWDAEPVGYVQQDGTVQWATIGPKSFWPDWAPRPEAAAVEVESHFNAAPGLPASGLAAVAFKGKQQAVAEQYEDQLKIRGFEVTRYAYQTWSADIPSRPFILCMIEGVQPTAPKHTVRLSFAVNSGAMPPKLYWTEGEAPPLLGMAPGPCF